MMIHGVGIGRGVAVGPVLTMADPLPEPADEPRSATLAVDAELERAKGALRRVGDDLEQRADRAENEGQRETGSILRALGQMAADPSLLDAITSHLASGQTTERSVYEGFGDFEQRLSALGGYMAERAADLHGIGQQVIADVLGVQAPGIPSSDKPFILVARDLSPAQTASLDMRQVLGIVTSQGGPTSHTAILARARGVVAVVSAADAESLSDGQTVIVDAAAGVVGVDPSDEEIRAVEERQRRGAQARSLRGHPGSTKDGVLVPLLANVGKPADAALALECGAEGVGLFRTEFLFMGNAEPPSVDEQAKAYEELLSRFPGRKVVIRMLDAGSDKPLAFLTAQDEPNPALGVRGLRALRTHPKVLEDQLEALAIADGRTQADLWVMAPMVADEHEAEYFVALGKSKGLRKVGVMAEIPAIAFLADKIAEVADFVSIGTNDLTQYTLAADRTLSSVVQYQTAWHPAVLRAIERIARAGADRRMPVGVCGEAAADPDLAVVLVGMGVTSLSMTSMALDDVRARLAEVTIAQARERAAEALSGEHYHPKY
ncbi:phosphoenolpyruvate--protein phosphotransferase [Bifidobacterium mongoliense]|jgi:phosphotransferase system enzyme I (PtsI)|uniref:phosphoenolpyruvate--protein phosphotransferase n=1 Tax=Bifidobacterium mongoliense TaxID=518643 RepID=UPI00264745B4|nr:phosphoenolpyruvate--protein phosphotransferase [Bifidobacterium mongoliense]MDN6025477.1 phosphoenolpyruvate--protein phosphotransferase [Bifidobacterium mongoliense]MDN6051519.1 phosphoenolpyruvate--protein phosphotransferase [Bifidobacterium mongoliense]